MFRNVSYLTYIYIVATVHAVYIKPFILRNIKIQSKKKFIKAERPYLLHYKSIGLNTILSYLYIIRYIVNYMA